MPSLTTPSDQGLHGLRPDPCHKWCTQLAEQGQNVTGRQLQGVHAAQGVVETCGGLKMVSEMFCRD